MKTMLLCISIVILRCCWGPTEYQLMQHLQNDDTILKALNGTYNINTLNQEDVSAFKLHITFDDDTKKISGFSGCNRFFGSYTLNKNSLNLSSLGSTRMLCSEDKNKIENALLKAFDKADTVLFSENGFSLFNKKKPLLSATRLPKKSTLSFEYSAISRGSYKHVKINKDTIHFSKKRNSSSLKTPCDAAYWNTLTKLYDNVDLKSIPNLEAPSKAFQYDGAAIAHLKITSNGKTYESAPFDHGNPPKEIAALVKAILSSAENIE